MIEWIRLNLRFLNWKLRGHGQLIYIDFPIAPRPRQDFGSIRLSAILDERRNAYADLLDSFTAFSDQLSKIKDTTHFPNFASSTYFPSGDAAALYCIIRMFRPKRIIEVGSGISTHFARMAVQDGKLSTHITAIDPQPRQEIHAVADKIVAAPLEDVDLAVIDELEANDVFFFDGSHRAFTNSDVTVAFLDILPRLKPGVLVHFHDIFIPADYPANWNDRFYNEQYLLACYLLAETPRSETILPMSYITNDRELSEKLARLGPVDGGGSFWLVMSS
ncbi:MAG: class I SAM-dependent methyltransferase [Chloroflexi bacterium]|nr:class I SAM-dependent methyltransferase [Chloroflexota bacterium]